MVNQQWIFDAGSYCIRYAGNSNKCIDALGWQSGSQGGVKLGIWDCNGHDSQNYGYDLNQRTVYLARSTSNADLCMDIVGGGTDDGSQLQVWQCNSHTNQKWDIRAPGPSPPPGPPGPGGQVTHQTIQLSGMVAGSSSAILTYPTNGGNYPFITFAHGTDAPPHVYQGLFDTVAGKGFVIAAMEGFAHGESLTGWKDVRHAIDAAKAAVSSYPGLQKADFNKVGLLGHSMGGGYVTAIATDGGDNK
jgi:hypothetical protein